MMFNTSELILDAVILSIVASTPEGISGFKIVQNVRSKIDVPENTFYPLLKQMQADGYLEVYHKDIEGRSRRYYKITDAGREHLAYCQQTWNSYLQGASSLLMNDPSGQGAPAPQAQAAPEPQVQAAPEPQAQAAPEPAVSPVQEVPAMEVQPQVAPQMQAAPVMEPQPVPQMQVAPDMMVQPEAAPVYQEPAAEVQPSPMMDAQPVQQDEFVVAGASGKDMDFEFSIGDDDSVNSDDMGFSSEDDLFQFDSIPTESYITYDSAPAEGMTADPGVPQAVYQEPVAEAQPVYQEPVYEDPAAPVAMDEAQPVYEEPAAPVAMDEAQPVYEEPAAAPEQQPVYEEPAAPAAAEAAVPEEPAAADGAEEPVSMEEIPAEEAAAPMSNDDYDEEDEADFLAEIAMGDAEEMEEEASPEEQDDSMSDIETINALEGLLNQLQSFETEINTYPEQNNNAAATQEAPVSNMNITDINAVAAMLNTPQANTAPAPHPSPAASYNQSPYGNSDDSVDTLASLLKDDGGSKKKGGFFSGWGKKKNSPREMSPSPVPTSRSMSSPTPPMSRVPESSQEYDSVDGLASLLKNDGSGNSGMFNKKNRTAVPSGADQFRYSSSTPVPVSSNRAAAMPAPPKPEVGFSSANPIPIEQLKAAQEKARKEREAAAAAAAAARESSSSPTPVDSKSFEEKAASPNARQVETTATITKPIDAKAISTKSSDAKTVEAKNVETNVTPKQKAPEQPQEPQMDDFRKRLMQAHLIKDGEDK